MNTGMETKMVEEKCTSHGDDTTRCALCINGERNSVQVNR